MNEQKRFISRGLLRVGLTLTIVTIATVFGIQLWRHYVLSPWTRDGRVVANSVTVAAEVGGRIVDIRVRENQFVRKGNILFIIDQSTYQAALQSAEATAASNLANMQLRQANAARGHKLTKLSISAEQLEDLDLDAKAAGANYQQALAA